MVVNGEAHCRMLRICYSEVRNGHDLVVNSIECDFLANLIDSNHHHCRRRRRHLHTTCGARNKIIKKEENIYMEFIGSILVSQLP